MGKGPGVREQRSAPGWRKPRLLLQVLFEGLGLGPICSLLLLPHVRGLSVGDPPAPGSSRRSNASKAYPNPRIDPAGADADTYTVAGPGNDGRRRGVLPGGPHAAGGPEVRPEGARRDGDDGPRVEARRGVEAGHHPHQVARLVQKGAPQGAGAESRLKEYCPPDRPPRGESHLLEARHKGLGEARLAALHRTRGEEPLSRLKIEVPPPLDGREQRHGVQNAEDGVAHLLVLPDEPALGRATVHPLELDLVAQVRLLQARQGGEDEAVSRGDEASGYLLVAEEELRAVDVDEDAV